MPQNAFYALFIEELQDLYSAENQIIQALPAMISAVSTPELKEALEKHFKETKNQVSRLDQIFSIFKENPQGKKCKAMEGLIEEAQGVLKSNFPAIVRDAAIIGAAQRIEHYEIAGYGVAKAFAKILEYDKAVDLLQASQDEEGHADKTLTSIAEGGFFTAGVNQKAMKS